MTKEQKYVSDEEVIQYIKEQEVVTWDLLEKRFGITRVALWRKLKKIEIKIQKKHHLRCKSRG